MLQQFYRTQILLGIDNINLLASKHVVVAGVGGVGGQVAESLVRAGIGRITLIDNDVVDVTNINRQLIATLANVGLPKVECFYQRLMEINPECDITIKQVFLDSNNISELIHLDADYVFDCIDTVPSKLALILYCLRYKIKIISSMGAGNRIDPTKVKISDIAKTKMCGLAKVIRLSLKSREISKGLTVVYSEEHQYNAPLIPELGADGQRLRPINGTVSYLPPLFGLFMVGFAVKQLIK